MTRPAAAPAPLTYGPAYLGLYACLTLGVMCNCFLDIQYGHFGFEVTLWALLFGLTLFLGWRQQGVASELGRGWQKAVLVMAGVLFFLILLPVWGMPRGGLYLLCGMQAAQNCISVSRRYFYMGLLVSAVLVLFAAAHYRADWTMLFYLLPYVLAVVLSLVAEQVDRRSRQVQAQALGDGRVAGQGLAAVTASLVILGLAGLFYAITPQVSWADLSWKHGLPGGVQLGESPAGGGAGGGSGGHGAAGGSGGGGGGAGEAGPLRSAWPGPGEMRLAARRPGMPEWQASAINHLADWLERLTQATAPACEAVEDWWERFKQWMQEHLQEVVQTLLALLLLALVLAYWLLARETGPLAWLRTRLDYLRLGLGGHHGAGGRGIRQYFHAAERLFAYYGEPRAAAQGPREYGRQLHRRYPDLAEDLHVLTGYFDIVSYSGREPRPQALAAMRQAYRRVFRTLTD